MDLAGKESGDITTARERTAHWTKIRRSRARFSGLAASCRMTWSAGFITSTSESNFSVRTGHEVANNDR
jgi:hypothetical protein